MTKFFASILTFFTALLGFNSQPANMPLASVETPTTIVTASPILPNTSPFIIKSTPFSTPEKQTTQPPLASPQYRPIENEKRDTIAPSISFAGPGQTTLDNQGHVCYGFTANDSVTPREKILYRYKLDTNSWSDWKNWGVISQGVCFNLTQGNHIVYYEAQDEAGNIGQSSLNQLIPILQPAN